MTAQTHYKTPLKPTPFHRRTAALCHTNDWGRWGGFNVANSYGEVELEYFAVRNSATLFDLTPMMKYRIAGPDAERYLNRLVTRDVRKQKPGRVAYSIWCDDAGHVLDDGTLFRFGDQDFSLCSQERQLVWLTDSAVGFDVKIEDVTEQIAALALQGPTSAAILKRMGLSHQKARPVHPKSDPDAQDAFEKGLSEALKVATQAHPDKTIRLYFRDEASGMITSEDSPHYTTQLLSARKSDGEDGSILPNGVVLCPVIFPTPSRERYRPILIWASPVF